MIKAKSRPVRTGVSLQSWFTLPKNQCFSIFPKPGCMYYQKIIGIPAVASVLPDCAITHFDLSLHKKCLIWTFGLDLVQVWGTQIFLF